MPLFAGTTTAKERAFRFGARTDRKSTRLNSSHSQISYAVFCLKKKTLDSFGSATMALDGKLLSRPSDRGRERAVADALAPFYYGVYVPPLASKAVPSSASLALA